MDYYLIRFTYLRYCQGYEKATATVLVHANSFGAAVDTLLSSKEFTGAKDFENLTYRQKKKDQGDA